MTSLQKTLGHGWLNLTTVYARVHDRTVAENYYTAMAQVEERLDRSTSSGQALTTETDGADGG